MGAFHDTKIFFSEVINYKKQLSYDEWMMLNPEYKAAALFVNYFPAIFGAWEKCKSFYTPEEDGVSTMMQYLQKNVPILEETPAKYTPQYIYRVAYNCLYCICHDIKSTRRIWENETSNIVGYGEDELDLFDLAVASDGSMEDQVVRQKFWNIVRSLGPKSEKVLNHIMNGDSLGKVNKCSKKYKSDPLRDIEVKLEEVDDIPSEIRLILSAFRSEYYR